VREIKFRYFYGGPDGSIFNKNFTLDQIEGGDHFDAISDSPLLKNHRVIGREQFSGFIDNDSVEICEEDIVRHHTDFNPDVHGDYVDYVIVYRNGHWMTSYWKSEKGQVLPVGYTCGTIQELYMTDISKEFYFTDHDHYKTIDALMVIGNTYENPLPPKKRRGKNDGR
jgi:hypothetical protein